MRKTFPLFLLLILQSLLSFSQDAADTSQKIFEKVDVEATFPGGESAWRRFLEKNLDPNVPVDNGAPCGLFTVYAQFVVDKDGSVSDVKALTNLGYGTEQEVVRILRKSGLWTPAMQNGKPVKAYRKQPVTFMIQDDAFTLVTRTPYVLYTNTENELSVSVDRVNSDHLELEITEGAIAKNEDGKFIALVKKPGRVIITLYHKKRRNKPIGAMSFEVRDPAPPKNAATK